MKKTLAAVAVLGAFAGSAIAADVTRYGIVDTGVGYNHIDFDVYGANDDIDSFSMMSGQASGSRWARIAVRSTASCSYPMVVSRILSSIGY